MKEALEHSWMHTKGFRKFIFLSFVFVILMEVAGIFIPFIFGDIINKLHEGGEGVYTLIFLGFIALLSENFLSYLRELVDLKKYFWNMRQKVEAYALQKMMRLSIGQHLSQHSGMNQSVIQAGVANVKDVIMQTLFSFLPNVLYILIAFIGILILSWKLAVVVLLFGTIATTVTLTINKRYEGRLLNLQEMRKQQDKFKSEAIRNIVTVKINAQENRMLRLYEDEIIRVDDVARRHWIGYMSWSHVTGLVNAVTITLVLAIGTYMIQAGEHSVGTFVVFYSLTGGIVHRLSSVRRFFRDLAIMIPPIQKYLDLVNTEPNIIEDGDVYRITNGSIRFQNVFYSHGKKEGEDRGVFGLNFEIGAGEKIGVVGYSGAGKSTLARLVVRAWDPDKGTVYIDGISLKRYAPDFRRDIGYVQQEEQFFDQSVRDSLTFGVEEAVSDKTLWAILETVKLKSRILERREGLDAIIGERGIKLSGGERQRLAIARTIIRDTKILLLDEATSSLDASHEGLLQEAIDNASKHMTTIIIAHRFSTLKNCDRIMVMDKGRIVGFDTHEELLKLNHIYRELAEKQALPI